MKENKQAILINNNQLIECLIYEGKIAILPSVSEKIEKLIELWSNKNPKIEWCCVCYGEYAFNGKEAIPLITGFIELPSWNLLNRENGLSININDIIRIKEANYNIIALLHSHPFNILPSPQDLEAFIYIDIILGKPLFYIIVTPDKNKLIISFEKCWNCQNSFIKIIQNQAIKKQHV